MIKCLSNIRILDSMLLQNFNRINMVKRGFTGYVKKPNKLKRFVVLGSAALCGLSAFSIYEIFYTESQAKNWQLAVYSAIPLNLFSRAWGAVNNLELPERLRTPVYKWYIKSFNVNLEEAAVKELKHYRNLGEFFRRRLSPGVRVVDSEAELVSPSDGKVLHCGAVSDGNMEQVKGVSFLVQQFLGPNIWNRLQTQELVKENIPSDVTDSEYHSSLHQRGDDSQLFFCTIYLGPGDYHGFHSPADWTVSMRRHFPGGLLSVNPSVARWARGLFNVNERAVYVGEWKHGFFSMAPVGATNVGSIRIYHDQDLKTNQRGSRVLFDDLIFASNDVSGLAMRKGVSFGEFNLGSSIVLIFEAPRSFRFNYRPGDVIKYGQCLGTCDTEEDVDSVPDVIALSASAAESPLQSSAAQSEAE